MRIITFQDISSQNITPSSCLEWASEMIKNKGKAILPSKISMKPQDGVFCNVMPSVVMDSDSRRWGGVKVVTRYPARIPSLESRILLMDADTGEFLALMDGTWITAMRTGAVATHSILLLGKKDFKTIGIMGLGNVVRSTLMILGDVVKDRDLNIKLLRYKGQEEDLANRFSTYTNFHFRFVDTPEEMVKGSDIVLSGATYLPNDICGDEYFDKGVLVQPIHTLGFTNCDLFFDKVFADDIGHIRNFKNFEKFKSVAEMCDVVNQIKPGRENDEERILAYNIGVSTHDIFFASAIYQLMNNKGLLNSLPDIDMQDPTEKFWV